MSLLMWFAFVLGCTQLIYCLESQSVSESAQPPNHEANNVSDSVHAGTIDNTSLNNETICPPVTTNGGDLTTPESQPPTGASDSASQNNTDNHQDANSSAEHPTTSTPQPTTSTSDISRDDTGNVGGVGMETVATEATPATVTEETTAGITASQNNTDTYLDANSSAEHPTTSTPQPTTSTSDISSADTGNVGGVGIETVATEDTPATVTEETTAGSHNDFENHQDANSSIPSNPSTSILSSTTTSESLKNSSTAGTGSYDGNSVETASTGATKPTVMEETTTAASTTSRKWRHKQLVTRNSTIAPTTPPSGTTTAKRTRGTPVPIDYDGDYYGDYYDISKVTFRRKNTTTLAPDGAGVLPRGHANSTNLNLIE